MLAWLPARSESQCASPHTHPSKQTIARTAALVLATGLTGVSLVTLAAPAGAADNVWDRVAACESGGNWSINTGNGFYGGLQFSLGTWRAFGGTAYAARPDQAAKLSQILTAQRTLKVQGPGAWPTCGPRAGLTMKNGLAPYGSSTPPPKSPPPKSPPPKAPAPVRHPHGPVHQPVGGPMRPLAVDGDLGPLTTKAIQRWLHIQESGSFGPVTRATMQRRIHTVPDTFIGPKSVYALQSYIGARHNGSPRLDFSTVRSLQGWLNVHIID